jgi:co-chaperonin GroES (HSP10)
MIKPLGEKFIAKDIPKKERVSGSIILPDVVYADLLEGEVTAVSDDPRMSLKVGDVVIFAKNSGLGDKIDGEQVRWLQLGEVWGVVQEDGIVKDLNNGL